MFELLEKALRDAEAALPAGQTGTLYETWTECLLSAIAPPSDAQFQGMWAQYLTTLPCAGCMMPNASCAGLCKHAQVGSAVSEGGGGGDWSGS